VSAALNDVQTHTIMVGSLTHRADATATTLLHSVMQWNATACVHAGTAAADITKFEHATTFEHIRTCKE